MNQRRSQPKSVTNKTVANKNGFQMLSCSRIIVSSEILKTSPQGIF